MSKLSFIFFLTSLLLSKLAFAENKVITVSSSPIKNLTELITKDDIRVDVVLAGGTCPHEYALKPSDLSKIKNSKAIILLDKNFEHFMNPLIKNFKGPIINLSAAIGITPETNMHLWLNLEKDKKILHAIYKNLAEIFPEYQDIWLKNLEEATSKINYLIEYKTTNLSQKKSFILLSSSIEHLLEGLPNIEITKLYRVHGMISAKSLQILEKTPNETCILIEKTEDYNDFSLKNNHKIIAIESENWSIAKYKENIDLIAKECR